MQSVEKQIDLLYSDCNTVAYQALKELEKISAQNNTLYPFMSRFIEMIDHSKSYVRNRGLCLIACNAKWDIDCKIDKIIGKYLEHIKDIKPITVRQCIKYLPIIAKYKPGLSGDIIRALENANISTYPDSMQLLIYKDIQTALKELDYNY